VNGGEGNNPDRESHRKPVMGRCLEHGSYKTPEPQTGKRTGFLWAAKSS